MMFAWIGLGLFVALQPPPSEVATALLAQFQGERERELDYDCIQSGIAVHGSGRRQYCIDIESAGQKLVAVASTLPPQLEVVRVGKSTFLRQANLSDTITTTTAVGPIIEVKPYLQSCDRCDLCPCIGCGERCDCSCNALCRLRREPACAHTAGVLTKGRWYVSVDAPGSFTLVATLVPAMALRAGMSLPPRTLIGSGATQRLEPEEGKPAVSFVDCARQPRPRT